MRKFQQGRELRVWDFGLGGVNVENLDTLREIREIQVHSVPHVVLQGFSCLRELAGTSLLDFTRGAGYLKSPAGQVVGKVHQLFACSVSDETVRDKVEVCNFFSKADADKTAIVGNLCFRFGTFCPTRAHEQCRLLETVWSPPLAALISVTSPRE